MVYLLLLAALHPIGSCSGFSDIGLAPMPFSSQFATSALAVTAPTAAPREPQRRARRLSDRQQPGNDSSSRTRVKGRSIRGLVRLGILILVGLGALGGWMFSRGGSTAGKD